ncbi:MULTISPECIES: aminoglycoside phosphotransferase family protein [Spirulina sp. CCY15215]|uniref:phosphotransferase enzyme family protein n=1 Tax=Spirulina sp. CCY15215 TaxID=2767591 RepID=UPI00194F6E17|nr:aminoglycoside phosphotransferase family protein [Spirulina major]
MKLNSLINIASQFKPDRQILEVQEFGNGNINKTFRVSLDASEEYYFILQRINIQVFSQPELVMQNMRVFCDRAPENLQKINLEPDRRWEIPSILLTQKGQEYWRDREGGFWRAIRFIEGQTYDIITNKQQAKEVGYGLGLFHTLLSNIPCEELADTLEGFHILPRYLEQYDRILEKTSPSTTAEIKYALQFVENRRHWATILEDAKQLGKLPLRPIHGDPKVNNVMMDASTGQAIAMIDLDTIKPGLVHYDIGDCLRSGCNLLGEETENWDEVSFNLDLCQAILQGYFSMAQSFLTKHDYDYLYDGISAIAFELGLRFFSDYLAGNVYFKVKYPEHNLNRAIVQFKLVESIEQQESIIRNLIQECLSDN